MSKAQIFGIFAVMAITFFLTGWMCCNGWMHEAVKQHHAEYYLDSNHNRQWRWLPTPTPKP